MFTAKIIFVAVLCLTMRRWRNYRGGVQRTRSSSLVRSLLKAKRTAIRFLSWTDPLTRQVGLPLNVRSVTGVTYFHPNVDEAVCSSKHVRAIRVLSSVLFCHCRKKKAGCDTKTHAKFFPDQVHAAESHVQLVPRQVSWSVCERVADPRCADAPHSHHSDSPEKHGARDTVRPTKCFVSGCKNSS